MCHELKINHVNYVVFNVLEKYNFFLQVGETFEFDEVHLDGDQSVMQNEESSRFDDFEFGKLIKNCILYYYIM